MNILIAPNSMKTAANAFEIADAIECGLNRANKQFFLKKMPMADGGEHTLEVLIHALGGKLRKVKVTDPLNRPIEAIYGVTDEGTAIIDMTKASGFALLNNHERNPLHTSTYGTGLLIKDAMRNGNYNIILTLGGSATVDGGSGIMKALGIKLLDKNNSELPPGGGNLLLLDRIDVSEILPEAINASFSMLCDVSNPLLGEAGAAMVFAPQKGAGKLETMLLERCLTNFGNQCEEYSGKSLIKLSGAGAAGGVPVGMKAFFDAKIIKGSDYILNVLNAKRHIQWADIVITAEGGLDTQSFKGKMPGMLAEKSKRAGKKIICIAGKVPLRLQAPDDLFDAVFSIQNQPMSEEESIASSLLYIKNVAYEIGKLIG